MYWTARLVVLTVPVYSCALVPPEKTMAVVVVLPAMVSTRPTRRVR